MRIAWPRQRRDVRPLGLADRPALLELCSRDRAASVYVAARALELDVRHLRGSLLGYFVDEELTAAAWMSGNLVPVGCRGPAAEAIAARVRRNQRQVSSIFGPREDVTELWQHLRVPWREPLDERWNQPLMAIAENTPLGACPDLRVRPARTDEVPLLAPAAAAMFTEEIGYAPYVDRPGRIQYENSVHALVSRGHAYVIVEDGAVVFKADAGSVALGTCQIQGVWVAPHLRGRGIAAPAMAAVVQQIRAQVAPLVTLYVNDYNTAAVATYRRVGFEEVGTFATVLL